MAKLDFSNLDQTQHYEVGHVGGFDLSIFSEDLRTNRILTVTDFQRLVKQYGKAGLFETKPILKIARVEYPIKPNDFNSSFQEAGLPTGKLNSKLRKVEFLVDFGQTQDNAGNNPHIFKGHKQWVCVEEWRLRPTDAKPFHTRIGHSLKGNEITDSSKPIINTKIDIYFREDYLFADPSVTSLFLTYRLFAIIANYNDGSGKDYPIVKDNEYNDAKPTLEYKAGKSGDVCDVELYEAETVNVELKGLSNVDFLEYNALDFVYLPASEGNPSMLYSTSAPLLKGSLPVPNYVELDFRSPNLKKNPDYLGSDEDWENSLVYRFEIKPEHIQEHKDLGLAPNTKSILLTEVPDLVYSRIYPSSGNIECQVRYGYVGDLGNVSSPSSKLKTKLYQGSSVVDFQAPTPGYNLFSVEFSLFQSIDNISKYPVFGMRVTSVYDNLNFGNYIDHAREYLVYGGDYIANVEDIYSEMVAINFHVFETREDAVSGNNGYFISKSISVEELSNHIRLKTPILLEYKEPDGIKAKTTYYVKGDITFVTAPILTKLMSIPTNMIYGNITEFTTAPNVIEAPFPTFGTTTGTTLTKATSIDGMSYYGEVKGQDFYNMLTYKGDFKPGTEYKLGDEVKLGNRKYAFYTGTTPAVVQDENDPNLRKFETLGDYAKIPDMKAVFKAMGLSNDNIFNYNILPMGIRKENDKYPDMEATLNHGDSYWLKTMSNENKMLYISKGSYIDTAYQLAFLRRGLFGSGRTFRFGNHLYKIRFLSDEMRSSLDANETKYPRKQQGEFLLYDHLLRGTLAKYTPNEIGIEIKNTMKDWGSEPYPIEPPIFNNLPEQTEDVNFNTYFEGNGVIRVAPYKPIIIQGKANLDNFQMRLESTSEFIETTSIKYDSTTRELRFEFYNLPEYGMNEWQVLNVKLDEINPANPNQPIQVTIKIYAALMDASSLMNIEYEVLGQNANRIFNPNYVGHDKRFRLMKHEFIGYRDKKGTYGGYPQIVLNAPVVLEEVLPGFEPYNKSIITPGNTELKYMEEYDVGYYGEVDGREFFRPSELKEFLGLKNLVLDKDDDIVYFKTYYHGMICYIPNRTIGKLRVKDLIDKGLIFGFDSKEQLIHKGKKYKVMLLNTSECYDHHKGKEDTYKLNETEVGGLFKDIICRLTSKYDRLIPNIEKFKKSSVELDIKDTDKILTKDVIGEHLTENNFNILVGGELHQASNDDMIDYFPIIFIEATDYALDLTYPEGAYGKYTINKVEKIVTETYYEKEKVTKLRRVEKVRVTKTYESKTNVTQVPNGKFTIPITSRKTKQKYGLLGFYCNKVDLANIADPIYSKTFLDVRNQSGKQKILYSAYIKKFQDYLTKQYIVGGLNGKPIATAQPYHIHILFDTFLDGVEYIKNMTNHEAFIRINNDQYKKVNNIRCGDKRYPSALAGNTASKEMVYTINQNYQPNNPEVAEANHVRIETNITISDQNKDSELSSSWCSMLDKDGIDIQLPYLTPFVPYEDYKIPSKELINKFVEYLKQITAIQDKVQPEDMCFGFAVVNLDELAYSKSSIISGTIYTPNLVIRPDTEELAPYFGSDSKNRGSGQDYIDIFEKVEGTTNKIENIMIPIVKEEKYVEFETYTAYIDIKKKRQKKIVIEQVVYS